MEENEVLEGTRYVNCNEYKVIQTSVFIGRENMLEYLSTDFIFPDLSLNREFKTAAQTVKLINTIFIPDSKKFVKA